MPTGYTADIKDGISFQTYALNCARAFGACVMLRDEPGDYHLKAMEKARNALAKLESLTHEKCVLEAARAWDARLATVPHRARRRFDLCESVRGRPEPSGASRRYV